MYTPASRSGALSGCTELEGYALAGRKVVLDMLDADATRLRIDARTRTHRETISAEVDASAAKITHARAELQRLERAVDALLGDAYGLTTAQVAVIDSEFRP